jgi:HPr kinase/phosphorylase
LEQQYLDILGVQIPHMIIPVRQGRDMARLVEVAAYYVKMKNFGLNPASDLDNRILAGVAAGQQSGPSSKG